MLPFAFQEADLRHENQDMFEDDTFMSHHMRASSGAEMGVTSV